MGGGASKFFEGLGKASDILFKGFSNYEALKRQERLLKLQEQLIPSQVELNKAKIQAYLKPRGGGGKEYTFRDLAKAYVKENAPALERPAATPVDPITGVALPQDPGLSAKAAEQKVKADLYSQQKLYPKGRRTDPTPSIAAGIFKTGLSQGKDYSPAEAVSIANILANGLNQAPAAPGGLTDPVEMWEVDANGNPIRRIR